MGYQGLSSRSLEPAPATVVAREDPDRAAERAGQVGDGGVDGDDEVEAGDEGGGVGEVGELAGPVDELQAARRVLRLARRLADLQADELHAGRRRQRGQLSEAQAAAGVDRRGGRMLAPRGAGPDQADLAAGQGRQPPRPGGGGGGVGGEIGRGGRDGVQRHAEQPRQAEHGGLAVERRTRRQPADDLDAGQRGGEQPDKRRLDEQGDAGAERADLRDEADELQAVAEALFGEDQQPPAIQGLALPVRRSDVRPAMLGAGGRQRQRYSAKPAGQVAGQQAGRGAVHMRLDRLGLDRQRLVEAGPRLVQSPQREQRDAAIVVGVDEGGVEGDGAVGGGERLGARPRSLRAAARSLWAWALRGSAASAAS